MNFKKLLPHLLAVGAFVLIAAIYGAPALQGKKLMLYDVTQAMAGAQEVKEFKERTGEWSAWTNSMFGGMPSYLIVGDYPNSWPTKLGTFLNSILPQPLSLFLLEMGGMYLLLIVLGASPWLAALGAVAFCFGSYNVVNIKAGHLSKVLALAYAPPLLAGVLLTLRGRYWLGAALTALFLSLELYANHIQITYYVFLAFATLFVIEAVKLFRAGQTKQLALATSLLLVAGLIAVGTHSNRLWSTYDYAKESIRGKSELTPKPGTNQPADGLDPEYAFSYSYEISETLSLLVPNVYGGASAGGLTTDSELYKAFTSRGVEAAAAKQFVEQGAPVYWGSLPYSAAPAYAGAIVLFLFVLGMFLLRGALKGWLLGFSVLFTMLAWGNNFFLAQLFFDYFPYFNKFRAVNMLFSVVQMLLAIGAALGVRELVTRKPSFAELKTPLLWSLGLTAGVALILAVVPSLFLDFRTENDAARLGQIFGSPELGTEMLRPLREDRESVTKSDALRSLLFILLAAGAVTMFSLNRVKAGVLVPVLTVFTLFDLFGVAKRYFNSDDFVSKTDAQVPFTATAADEQILQDKSPSYRVLDQTGGDFTSDARASYFHKSLGGYHAAKLRRYQDVITEQGPKNFVKILNMTNVKYVIAPGQDGQPTVQQNPDAFGNAWFVRRYQLVPNADAEMAALGTTDLRQTAIVDQRFAPQLNGFTPLFDSSATIRLTEYRPNYLKYVSNANSEQLAVFSEVYYNVRDDWQVTIDGQPAEHFRADYLLRAMRVPAGQHTIEFRFDPMSVRVGNQIDLIASILLVLFIGVAVFVERRKNLDSKDFKN
jgi:hypothetical protein